MCNRSARSARRSTLRIGILMALTVLLFSLTGATAPAATFPDLQGNWSNQAVSRVAALNLIEGYPSGQFMPDQQVTLLESVVLLLKTCGYHPTFGQSYGTATGPASNTGTPSVPWGQPYVDLAVARNIIPQDLLRSFNPDAPATRSQVAVMLARLLQLPIPGSSATGVPAADYSITDLDTAPSAYIPYITAIYGAGLMQGYSDGSFAPQKSITRAEMAALLARMIDLNWAGLPAGSRAEGWLRSSSSGKGAQTTELVSLQGTKRITLSPSLACFAGGKEASLSGIMGARVEVLFNSNGQAACISLLDAGPQAAPDETVRGSVKSVVLGVDSYLVMSDLLCHQRLLPLAWYAVVESGGAKQTTQITGFQTLKTGAFIDAYLAGGNVVRVVPLVTKQVSGTITSLESGRLTLNVQPSANRPGWFDSWDSAQVVDSNGQGLGGVQQGDSVQITYLDPIPDEIGDQIPLQIIDTNAQ
jgi:hypothetical protein